ncbi:MAG TPA: TerC family protein [Polyangia bacterium]|nr:TerC family protein [Polyangia bacterium]
MHFDSAATPALWVGFTVLVLGLLAVDLFVLHRKPHAVRPREALIWALVYASLAMLFCGGVYLRFGGDTALEFLAGYVIEEALSVDNLFVFLVLFGYFHVPAELQHRVLFWGVVGALVLRAIFILLGASLIQSFHGVTYIFGGFLVVTGIRLLFRHDGQVHPERNPMLRLLRRILPVTDSYRGTHFTVVEKGRRHATPLLLVLVLIEGTDLVFAVDSIPAVFAVTTDPFIVYTSNIFAILGLRSLYFALAGMMERFHYLKVGLALVLAFVGAKMLVASVFKIPIGWSLGVVVALLAGSVAASLLRKGGVKDPARTPAGPRADPAARP